MAPETLVGPDIAGGRRLLQALDQAEFPVVAALWGYLEEAGAWRLFIASPKVDELGSLGAYKSIQKVLLELEIDLSLSDISAVSPYEPFINELRHFAGTDPAPALESIRLRKSYAGGQSLEAVYLYRAARILGRDGTSEVWSVTRDKVRRVWTARLCRLTLEAGFVTNLEIEGFDWPQRQTKQGLRARLSVLIKPEERKGATFGDVQRWTIDGGRLLSVETIARAVCVEGYSGHPPA